MLMHSGATTAATLLIAVTLLLACCLPHASARSCTTPEGRWQGWGGAEEASTFYNFTRDGKFATVVLLLLRHHHHPQPVPLLEPAQN
jgi:hypothetical protein